jgi:secreted trypsin-like serine protease
MAQSYEQQVMNRVPDWIVAFVRFGPGRRVNLVECAGTQVSPRLVLTAAHAVIDWRTTTAILGQDRISTAALGHMRSIKRFIRYPAYDSSITPPPFDLALVELHRPFHPHNDFVTLGTPTDRNSKAEVFGWGARGETELFSDRMKQIAVAVTGPDLFGRFFSTAAAGLHTCYGDSGAPLLIHSAGGWIQIGIASALTFARLCKDGGIYTPVAPFREWIADKIREIGD